jgi:hypothetical protein
LVTESPPTSINLERAAHKKLHTLSFGESAVYCQQKLPVSTKGWSAQSAFP